MASAPNEIVPGPPARRVAENVIALRAERGLSREALSERMTKVGRPILATGIGRLERGQRRVDVDDLIGLALALDVSPVRLLMPAEREVTVALTETSTAPWQEAWRWAVGELPMVGEVTPVTDPAVAAFIRHNRPFELQPAPELARWLAARLPGPCTAHVTVDAQGRAKARVTLGEDD